MDEWIRLAVDIVLIGIVAAFLVQATRLIKHLSGLAQSRTEMEKFVRDFNSVVARAEAGVKGLRQAARDSGDDLEKLLEKSVMVRDELTFLVESADQIAERLSRAAAGPGDIRPDVKAPKAETPIKPSVPAEAAPTVRKAETKDVATPSSRAEKELLQALQKLS